MADIDWQYVAHAALHPTQVEILNLAASRERISPVEVAESGEALSGVAYHFRRLVKLGLLIETGTSQRRGAVQHFYRLADSARS